MHVIQWDCFGVVKTPDDGRLRPKHIVRSRSGALLTEYIVYNRETQPKIESTDHPQPQNKHV
jgi:hypothetical protein